MDELELQAKKVRFKNVIAIAGLETLKNKQGVPYRWADTFLNNVNTWIKDVWLGSKGGGKALILDARNYSRKDDPLGFLLAMAIETTKTMPDGLDALLYTGHGDMDALYVFSKTRTELPNSSRFIMMDTPTQEIWSQLNWSKNTERGIWLATCRAGGDGKKFEKCIAQHLSDTTGISTWAFLSRCSQRRRADGGYYQYGIYVEFTPKR